MSDSRAIGTRSSLAYPIVLAFGVSASILLLQLVQTRIYSVVFWNHLVYFIVSIALMGFGISGTWMAFGPNTRLARFLNIRTTAVLYAVTALGSSLFMPRLEPGMDSVIASGSHIVVLLLTYIVAVLPYFFGGWLLGGIFSRYVKNIHVLYFADLVGAAAGCAVYLVGMQPLGAVNLVVIAAAAVALPVIIVERGPARWFLVIAAVACFVLISLSARSITRSIEPERTKAYNGLFSKFPKSSKIVEFTEWNTISRIDVVSVVDRPEKYVFIDGDAWTGLVVNAEIPASPYQSKDVLMGGRAAYFFRPKVNNVLVLGTGGGMQVYQALRAGAGHVDAVEINPTTWRLPLREYRGATHELMHQPGVNSYREEGRSFIRRSNVDYDVIVIHAIDTFAALNAGAYMLAENYLYTVEAMKDYYSALSGDGILIMSRWYHPAETPRLFAVALEALIELGVSGAESHIIMQFTPDGFGTLIMGAAPFSADDVARFRAHIATDRSKTPPRIVFPRAADELEEYQETTIAAYAHARAQGKAQAKAYLDTLAFKISPVYDDSPFFFHFDRASHLRGIMSSKNPADFVRGNWPSFTLFTLLAFSIAIVALLMFVPLMQRGRPRVPGFGAWLLYFSSIGVAFIFIEIVLMQRFALLLGHPSRSLALVLASLLFFAGVGSYARSLFRIPLAAALVALLVLIPVAAFVYPSLVHVVLPYSLFVRGAVTVALVAPLGFFMGMPFPSGLAGVSACGDEMVPWMWGINGATTVLGSILAIVLAIPLDFTTVLMLAFASYAVTLASYLYLSRKLHFRFEI